MKKRILIFLSILILFKIKILSCGAPSGSVPYITGPFGDNDLADQTSLGTIVDNTTCNDAALTFTFSNLTQAWRETDDFGCGEYQGHKWILDGNIINNNSAMSISLDPDNLSNGFHHLYVHTYSEVQQSCDSPYSGLGCCGGVKFYYNFTINKITPQPDLEPFWVLPSGQFNQQSTYNLPAAIANDGDTPCGMPSTATVRVWASIDTDNVYTSGTTGNLSDALLYQGSLSIQSNSFNPSTTNLPLTMPKVQDFAGYSSSDYFVSVYIIMSIDYNNSIAESNEPNNIVKSIRNIINPSASRMTSEEKPTIETTNSLRDFIDNEENNVLQVHDLNGRILWQRFAPADLLKLSDLLRNKIYILTTEKNNIYSQKKIILID